MMNPQIKKAAEFAQRAHMAQMYDQYPYFKHLENVYNVLLRFGFKEENLEDLDILIASWLHDVMEDTARSYSDVKKEFGQNVAEIVYCLTDELGRNRKEKKEKTYPKIRSNSKSIILKVADRIANIEYAIENKNQSFVDMYSKEFEDFQHHLRLYKHIDEMWSYLQSLFPHSEHIEASLSPTTN